MATDISSLLNKQSNAEQQQYVQENAIPANQVLSAQEFVNKLVKPVIELQEESQQAAKAIKRGNTVYRAVDGVITLPSDGTQVQVLTTVSTTKIVSVTGEVKIPLAITSVENGTDTAEAVDVDVQVYENGDYVSRGTFSRSTTPFGNPVYAEEDITKFLTAGDQMVRLVATGKETGVAGRLVFASIVLTKLTIEFAGDYNVPVRSSINPYYYIYGVGVQKMLHLRVSGSGGFRDFEYNIGTSTYTTSPFTSIVITDGAMDVVKVLTHGAHTLEAWLTCDDGSGNLLESEHIVNTLMVVADDSNKTPYLLLQNVKTEAVNYEQINLLQYAVYNPTGESMDVSIVISDYSGTGEYLRLEQNVPNQTKTNIVTTIEVEDSVNDYFYAYLHVYRYVNGSQVDFMLGSIGESSKVIHVDNRDKFSPTQGADFFLNPKVRNNSESDPRRILNAAKNNEELKGSEWKNFGLVNDGWVTAEDQQKVLRVLAGQYLTIPYEPFLAFKDNSANSMTLELDFKTRNVTDERSPILRVCSTVRATGNPLGLYMRPMDGFLFTLSKVTEADQNFGWQEGVRTHISINIVHALRASVGATETVSLVRIFINGVLNREFQFDKEQAGEFISNTLHGGIRIGQEEADIDIYSIRCYTKALSEENIRQNYASTLPTSELKRKFRDANAITENGEISYRLAKEKYNTIVLHGYETSHANQEDTKVWLEVTQLNADGTVDKSHSGTICKETGTLPNKGQGSTAKTYYDWNQQQDIKKTKGTIVVGGKEVTDGWIDGNGQYQGAFFKLDDSSPKFEKAVGKINYASSMQSHKQGATELYNLLHTAIVGKNTMQKADSKARVAVLERPFLYFVQTPTDPEPVFRGLMTWGSGKMDKKTWGYDSKVHTDFAMLEGSDNNKPLTDMRVPWDEKVTYNVKEEYFEYNGDGNLDFDAGLTYGKEDDNGNETDPEVLDGSHESGQPKDVIVEYYKNAWNWLFLHNPRIRPYINGSQGNLANFLADQNVSTDYFYWMTSAGGGAEVYDLYRYDYPTKSWVKAGMRDTGSADGYAKRNLYAAFPSALDGIQQGDWDGANNAFIAAIVADAKKTLGNHFNALSLRFHYAFVNHLLAGTDNCSKNTYYVLDPSTHLIEMHQDDLDTIFKTDNSAYQIKPYYVDRMHPYTEDGVLVYTEGTFNVLCNLMELMWEGTGELASMMNTILVAMTDLVDATDVANGIEKSPMGAFQKYFFSVQEYFPAIAYNETARIRYEYPASLNFVSDRNVKPITQSLGDQLESEKQYMKRRLVYVSSYAAYGEFGVNGDGGFGFQTHAKLDGTSPTVILDVTPHQYLYPTARVGQTLRNPHVRLAPNQTYHFVIDDSGTLGDTVCGLKGANYYRSFGNIGNLSVSDSLEFQITGERLVEVIANPTNQAEFRPSTLGIVAPLVKNISLKGSTGIRGQLDLSRLTRMRTLDVRDTAITQVKFPSSELMTEARLGGNITALTVDNLPNLSTLTMQGYQYLESVSIGSNVGHLDSYAVIIGCYQSHAPLSHIALSNVRWTGVDVGALMWMTDIESASIKGEIDVLETSLTAPAITYEYKNKLIRKWGNVDDPGAADFGGLKLSYAMRRLTSATMMGNFYNDGSEGYLFELQPNTAYDNSQTKVVWSATQPQYGGVIRMDAVTGMLYVDKISTLVDSVTVSATVYRYGETPIVITKSVEIYDRPAKEGDFVYADGTFSDSVDERKTVVGICFYVAPRYASGEHRGDIVENLFNPNDKQTRLMVSCRDVTAQSTSGTNFTSWQWGSYPSTTDATNGLYYKNASGANTSFTGVEQGFASGCFYDIQSIGNITSTGLVADPTNQNSGSYIGDNNLRDESSTDGINNNGWKAIVASSASGDGFGYAETRAQIAARTLDNELALLAGNEYHEGDIVNSGYAKTLKIIRHRNAILRTGLSQVGINSLDAPSAGAGFTENESLANLIEALRAEVRANGETNANKWSQIYYPAASAAYGYQPTGLKPGETLNDKFKSHNWFLPTQGQLARMCWYYRMGNQSANKGKDIFQRAINAGKFVKFSATGHWSSTELNQDNAWGVNFYNGGTYNNVKYNSYVVRAVAAF